MIDTEAQAAAEQQAAAVDVPEGVPLYSEEQQRQYALAALRFRQAAFALEDAAVATDARLAQASRAGAYRFIKEGRRLMAEAVGGEGG